MEQRHIFIKKYHNEKKRRVTIVLFVILFLISVLAFQCYRILSVSQNETTKAEKFFDEKNDRPDLIVIFTGDLGRISGGLLKAKQYNQPHILVTGVHPLNSAKKILALLPKQIKKDGPFNPKTIEIDHSARNTIENVLATFNYARNDTQLKNILIISSDYHILRIKMIFKKLKDENSRFHFYYYGIPSDYKHWRSIKILLKEIIKTMKAWGLLSLWDYEANQLSD